jgi:prolyl oligopeptidase
MKDAKDVVSIYSIDGKLKKDLPVDIGSIDSITGRPKDSACFLKFSSFLNPGLIYKYDFKKDDFSLFRKTELKVAFDASDLVQEQIFYASKDGTKIPMFVVGTKNKTLDGTGRCLLYGYGGFDIPLTPFFSPTWLCFILFMGGTVAVANLRGGGEYGETWHDAGKILNKQNVFDDFQYAAKYLIEKKYTSSQYLGINGGSNGGLLVGACVNQAPELFGCAIADVGVMDMLRFHLHTIGHAWCSDYGNPDQEEHFKNLVKYSPYHNVRQNYNKYPSVLLCTSDHDDRVVPLHSYKFAAELQHWNKDNARPLLLRVETKAGHGAGKPTKKRIEEATDKFSFLALSLGCKFSEK